MMRKIYYLPFILLLAGFTMGTVSCGGGTGGPEELQTAFEVAPLSVIIPQSGGTDEVKVTFLNVDWNAEVDEDAQDWLEITPDKTTGVISIDASGNDGLGRVGYITVTPNHTDYTAKRVTVTQIGEGGIAIDIKEINFEASGNDEVIIKVTTADDVNWSMKKGDGSWFTATKGQTTITVSTTNNTDTDPRQSSITVLTDNDDIEDIVIPVKQRGRSVLTADRDEITFDVADNDPFVVNLTAYNVDWEFDIPDNATSWLSATKAVVSDGKETLTVSVTDNNSGKQRDATITITDSRIDEPIFIDVLQKVTFTLSVNRDEVIFDGEEPEEEVIVVNSNLDWTHSLTYDGTETDWLDVQISGNNITLTAEPHMTGGVRTATLTIEDPDGDLDPAIVNITQNYAYDVIFDEMTVLYMNQSAYGGKNYYQILMASGEYTIHTNGKNLTVTNGYWVNFFSLFVENRLPGMGIKDIDYDLPDGVYTSGDPFNPEYGTYQDGGWDVVYYEATGVYRNNCYSPKLTHYPSLNAFAIGDGDVVITHTDDGKLKMVLNGTRTAEPIEGVRFDPEPFRMLFHGVPWVNEEDRE